MKFKIILFIVLLLTVSAAKAQDPIFSQANYVQETLNPGFSGFEDNGKVYAGVLSRLQWPNLDLKLTTQYAFVNKSFDYGPDLGFGIGVNAVWQYESFNNYNYFQINTNYAHRINLDGGWFFRPGIEVGVGNKSNRFRNLRLGDQININTGTINPNSVDPLANTIKNPYFVDFSTGIVFEKEAFYGTSYWFGASVKHLNRPNISFVEGEKVPLDIFYSLHGNYRFPFLNDSSVMMTANYMQQGQYNRLDVGSLFQVEEFLVGLTAATNPALNDDNSHLLTSINAFIGLEYSELRFGFSYDMNTSKIGNTYGVYEFSLTYLSRCKSCNLDRSRKR
ncbi:type IX secretion system membrane protein PorP/SprF [Bizionia gelidisalsuginis]|uniref:Type IX secretion system membrane protein PorP/SprF n=2 Tax=Bizionia TaxID=283785 RepID=A0A8H2LB85_9FLAO|nr:MULTISPECIES: PorP/SprF family type IX secretion system membrane protein [Bizionia]TYB72152.1 type IX secretion system membrane protein PorP/SprF [Bizionia saleffrena]TYC08763.1 type IX secretion system membrane protein PorP/SprF [Bizionia gelidisalsuginis]